MSTLIRAAAVALLLALGAGPVWAQKVWLAGPEGSALSLEDAIRQAKDGDTVELLPGDYKGGVVLENRT